MGRRDKLIEGPSLHGLTGDVPQDGRDADATSELASRELGHSSSQVIRDHYIAKPPGFGRPLRAPRAAR